MKLGTQVGIGPGHIVLDGDPAPPPQKGLSHPLFGPYPLRPNGFIDQDATWYGGRPRPRRLCVRWGHRSPPQKRGGAPQIFGPCLLWLTGQMDQDGTWHGGRLRPKRLCVRWGPSPPLQKGGAPLKFSAHVYCGQTAGWITPAFGMEVGLSPGDFVLDGDPAPLLKKGAEPPLQFLAHFYCAQTGGCTKISLGVEVGLRPGDFVLDGDPAPLNFSPMFIIVIAVSYTHLTLPTILRV